MSVCSPCFDSGISVAACNAGIAFGVVTPETEYTVTITHNATKKVQSFVVESDVDGILSIEGAKIDALQGYTIGLKNCEKFTICEVEYDCISFSVVNTDEEPEVINLLECVSC
jgi:TPP-dependent indolepyruvate ferredoxin oxidoreductase alpha subunit